MAHHILNIQIRDGIPEVTAVECVLRVIEMGRISVSNGRPCFCFVSRFTKPQDVIVYAELTRAGHDRFVVYRREVSNG